MIRLVQKKLIIPRGDTGTFQLPVLPFEEEQEAIGVFTILDPRTNTKIFEKQIIPTDNFFIISFTHGDTVNLPVGNHYQWDIKFYLNPVFADEKLISGEEVNSYHAAFGLPSCEIRQTGDELLTSDDAPDTTLTPESINILEAVTIETTNARDEAVEAAEKAVAATIHGPRINEDDYWEVWNWEDEQYESTGVLAQKPTYIWEQTTANAEWTIIHNLHRYPSVSIIDSGGSTCVGEVLYVNENIIKCTFSAAFSGTAYLN